MLIRDTRLKVFYEAARHRSFTRAAEVLLLTQPAVSFQIKSLEDDIGSRLFRREKSRVALTEVGEILYRHAQDILALYEQAEAEISRMVQHVGGQLHIGVASVVSKYVLPRPIGVFKRQNPQVAIVVETGNTDSLVEQLVRGELDLAIVSDPVEPKDWLRDILVLIVPPGHRWAARKAVTPQELLAEPFIMREAGSGTRRMLQRYLELHGWSLADLTVTLTLGSTEAVKAGVEVGAGVSIVSSLALKAELAVGALRTVAIRGLEMSRTFNLVYPNLSYRKVVVETFLGFCRAVAGTAAAEEADGGAARTDDHP